MDKFNCTSKKIINLLSSKIFHDIGNAFSLLNFAVEMNKDDPSGLEFKEIVDINARLLNTLKVLKYLFLFGTKGPQSFDVISEYFSSKGKGVTFDCSAVDMTEEEFNFIVHTVMMLHKILFDYSRMKVEFIGGICTIQIDADVTFTEDQLKACDALSLFELDRISATDDTKVHLFFFSEGKSSFPSISVTNELLSEKSILIAMRGFR